jgi:hypothetical protein
VPAATIIEPMFNHISQLLPRRRVAAAAAGPTASAGTRIDWNAVALHAASQAAAMGYFVPFPVDRASRPIDKRGRR